MPLWCFDPPWPSAGCAPSCRRPNGSIGNAGELLSRKERWRRRGPLAVLFSYSINVLFPLSHVLNRRNQTCVSIGRLYSLMWHFGEISINSVIFWGKSCWIWRGPLCCVSLWSGFTSTWHLGIDPTSTQRPPVSTKGRKKEKGTLEVDASL